MGCGGGGTQEIIGNNRASNGTCLNIDGISAFHQSKSTMINGTVDAEDYGNPQNLNLSRDSFVTRIHQPVTAEPRRGGARDRYSSSYGTQVPNLMSYDNDQGLSLNKQITSSLNENTEHTEPFNIESQRIVGSTNRRSSQRQSPKKLISAKKHFSIEHKFKKRGSMVTPHAQKDKAMMKSCEANANNL